jgi:hypothetical protein
LAEDMVFSKRRSGTDMIFSLAKRRGAAGQKTSIHLMRGTALVIDNLTSSAAASPSLYLSRAEKHPQKNYRRRRMKPSRICVAWQNKSSPWPSSGRMNPKPLWFQATQTPVLRGPPSPPNSPLLGAPPASRAPGLRERRGGLRERGRGSSRRGGLRSAILLVVCWLAYAVEREARGCRTLSSERLAAVYRCRARGSPQQITAFVFARQ